MGPPMSDRPVVVVVGTRPEVIKLAPVLAALERLGMPTFLLSTGQHREMLAQVLAVFGLEPDRDLGVMQPDQSLAGLSAALLAAADPLLGEVQPSWVVVQGDTTTVAMLALAAFYRQIPVAHVEAGLRTGRRYDPFPEEMNRTLLGSLADLHFAPTLRARDNLLAEGVPPQCVELVGNTVVDALRDMAPRVKGRPFADFGLAQLDRALASGKRLVLVTGHRRESFGAGLRGLCSGLAAIARRHEVEVEVVYPVHLNPNVRAAASELLTGIENVHLLPPVDYAAFVRLLAAASVVITDSGGVQEEAASLGIPVLVTRQTTERLEAVEAGVAELVGTDGELIARAARLLLTDADAYRRRAVASEAFGDGRAGERIAARLARGPHPGARS